jgi:hypothetical protein
MLSEGENNARRLSEKCWHSEGGGGWEKVANTVCEWHCSDTREGGRENEFYDISLGEIKVPKFRMTMEGKIVI